MGGNIPGGMIKVGNYAIPDSIIYTKETPDYVKNPLPSIINLNNLSDVINAVNVRITEKKEPIATIIFEGIGEAINRARSLPPSTFQACYSKTLEQIGDFFVPYVKDKVDSWHNSMNGRGTDGVAHEEVAILLLIAKTYFPELNGKLEEAHKLVEEHITILEDKGPTF